MAWADAYIARLVKGETVSFRPRGNSMTGKIESGQLVTVAPLGVALGAGKLKRGDIVLCKVAGSQYLHLVNAVQDDRIQIANNHGRINGWTSLKNVFGILTAVAN